MLHKDDDEDFTSHLSSVYDTDDDIKVAALFFRQNIPSVRLSALRNFAYLILSIGSLR